MFKWLQKARKRRIAHRLHEHIQLIQAKIASRPQVCGFKPVIEFLLPRVYIAAPQVVGNTVDILSVDVLDNELWDEDIPEDESITIVPILNSDRCLENELWQKQLAEVPFEGAGCGRESSTIYLDMRIPGNYYYKAMILLHEAAHAWVATHYPNRNVQPALTRLHNEIENWEREYILCLALAPEYEAEVKAAADILAAQLYGGQAPGPNKISLESIEAPRSLLRLFGLKEKKDEHVKYLKGKRAFDASCYLLRKHPSDSLALTQLRLDIFLQLAPRQRSRFP